MRPILRPIGRAATSYQMRTTPYASNTRAVPGKFGARAPSRGCDPAQLSGMNGGASRPVY